jgi:hypothetical protein
MLCNAVYNVIVLCNAVLTSVLMFYRYFSRHMPFSSFIYFFLKKRPWKFDTWNNGSYVNNVNTPKTERRDNTKNI